MHSKIIKLLEKSIKQYLHDVEASKDFLNRTPEVVTIKQKLIKCTKKNKNKIIKCTTTNNLFIKRHH